ncbi:hypothetical protein Tco_1328968 [Tanacetum coccineum]
MMTNEDEVTKDQTKEEIASKASQHPTQTPTSMTFGDDETIATLLLNMSKAKAASKEKEKRCKFEDTKGNKKIEERKNLKVKKMIFPSTVKKFKHFESDEYWLGKFKEDWEAEEERNKIAEEQATNEAAH